MKKLFALSLLALFYIATQQNFTDKTQPDRTCRSLQFYANSCEKILSNHLDTLKLLEKKYAANSLDYTVSLTAQNYSYIENYQGFSRGLNEFTVQSGRLPASTCTIEKNLQLKNCYDQAKKIYEDLFQAQTGSAEKK